MSRNRVLLSTTLSVLLCASLVFSVKADAATWTQTYEGPGYDYVISLVETVDFGYAIVGDTSNSGVANCDVWLVKTDAFGNEEWNMTYGGTGDDRVYSMINTADGGYAIVGYTDSFGAGGRDCWLVKTDEHGNIEWNMTYGGTGDDGGSSLVESSDGGYVIVGAWNYSIGVLNSFCDAWLVKTNSSGHMEWNQTYRGATVNVPSSLVEAGDGGYAIAGFTYYFGADSNFWLVKTDALGVVEWNMTYGGTGDDSAFSLVSTSDGGYALAGYTESFGAGAWDFWLVKTDASGDMEWNQTYGGTSDDAVYSMVVTPDDGYALAGYTTSFGAGLGDFWLVKTDSFGAMEWNMTYGG